MRVNREIDERVPHMEDPRGEVVPSPIRLRDRWYFDYTPRWPHLCIRKSSVGSGTRVPDARGMRA